jgi:hypothetical protein
MVRKPHLTTREIADLLGAPLWAVRRAVDALDPKVPRAGLYRLVPARLLPRVEAALRAGGHLVPREEAANG